MPWMCTYGLFTSIPIYPRSGLISGARTRAVTTRLEMPSTPTCGLQSLTQEMMQSPSDCICSQATGAQLPAAPSARCPSYCICRCGFYAGRPGLGELPLLHVNHSGVLSIAPIPVNQEARSPITLISVLQKHRLHRSEEAPGRPHPLLSQHFFSPLRQTQLRRARAYASSSASHTL
jgi:hypothetical protein